MNPDQPHPSPSPDHDHPHANNKTGAVRQFLSEAGVDLRDGSLADFVPVLALLGCAAVGYLVAGPTGALIAGGAAAVLVAVCVAYLVVGVVVQAGRDLARWCRRQ